MAGAPLAAGEIAAGAAGGGSGFMDKAKAAYETLAAGFGQADKIGAERHTMEDRVAEYRAKLGALQERPGDSGREAMALLQALQERDAILAEKDGRSPDSEGMGDKLKHLMDRLPHGHGLREQLSRPSYDLFGENLLQTSGERANENVWSERKYLAPLIEESKKLAQDKFAQGTGPLEIERDKLVAEGKTDDAASVQAKIAAKQKEYDYLQRGAPEDIAWDGGMWAKDDPTARQNITDATRSGTSLGDSRGDASSNCCCTAIEHLREDMNRNHREAINAATRKDHSQP